MLKSLGTDIQPGYVVRDIRAAMRSWAERLEVGPFAFRPEVVLSEAIYRGRPTVVRIAVGLAYRGDTMIELIQPLDDAASPFTEFLAAGREGLHHFGFWPADLDQAAQDCRGHGLALDYQVRATGTLPTLFFRDPGGVGAMIELIEGGAAKLASYEPIRALARDWRPGDPAWQER